MSVRAVGKGGCWMGMLMRPSEMTSVVFWRMRLSLGARSSEPKSAVIEVSFKDTGANRVWLWDVCVGLGCWAESS